MGGFEQGFQFGQDQQQRREASDMMQRQFLAQQYQNYANNIRLPDATQDPEGYKKALDLKQQALDAMQKVYSPDHHATLAEHLHGLIFGPKQAQGAPQSSQAPTLPPAPPATAPAHPFAHNPVYGDIIKGLDALGTHLKGFAQPNGPKQPLPKLSSFAGVPSTGDLAAQDAATKAKEAEKLAELRNQGQLDVAKARAQFATMSTPQKSFLNRWAVDHGADDFNGLSSDQQSLALKAFKGANAPASHLQLKAENGNLYTFDPATGKMTFKAKLGDVRKTQGVRFVTNALTGEVTEVPYTTYTSKESGEPIADDSGAPIGAADDQKAPVSAQAPSLDAVNSKIAAGNASSKKLNKGKPVSRNAPRVVAHTASLMDKSDAAQYTKIAEDANTKQQAYTNAAQAAQAPTPTSDTELIYSWVRSNVQGAGRMTQAEFKQAGGIGSVPLKADNWVSLATSGLLTPKLRQYMLADIKRSADTSQAQADNLRKRMSPVSSQAPQVGPKVLKFNPQTGRLE